MNSDKVLIISDAPLACALRVNENYRDYQPISFTVSVVREEVIVTAVMISRSELPRVGPAIAVPNGPMPRM